MNLFASMTGRVMTKSRWHMFWWRLTRPFRTTTVRTDQGFTCRFYSDKLVLTCYFCGEEEIHLGNYINDGVPNWAGQTITGAFSMKHEHVSERRGFSR